MALGGAIAGQALSGDALDAALAKGAPPVKAPPPPPAAAAVAAAGVMQPSNGADANPDAKRPRLQEDQQQLALEGIDAGTAAVLQQAGTVSEDQAWCDQWAEVFTLMQQNDMGARASEYAEAVVAVKQKAESLLRQRMTAQLSCEQLLHTAHREALQAHLKAMLEGAATGASQDLVDAARRTIDDLCPSELSQVQKAGPPWQGKQKPAAQLGIGMAQPGVVLPPIKAPGLLGLPSKALAAGGGSAASNAQGQPQQGLVAPLGQAGFSEIGQFAAAAAAAQQEAAAAHTNLWVGGLPEGIDEGMFRTLFSRYGSIVSVKLVSEKRFGFVKYAAREQAQAAIDALNGFECNGVKLSIKFGENKGLTSTGVLGANPFGISLPGGQTQS